VPKAEVNLDNLNDSFGGKSEIKNMEWLNATWVRVD